MDDPAMGRTEGRRRGVEEQETHEQDVPCPRRTGDLLHPRPLGCDRRRVQPAQLVRAGKDPQGAVVFIRIVEVYPDGDHPLENLQRGLNVDRSILERPRAVALPLDPLLHRDGQILMPRDEPVGFGCFVEKDGADGEEGLPGSVMQELLDFLRCGDFCHGRKLPYEIAMPGSDRQRFQRGSQRIDFLRVEDRRDEFKPIRRKRRPHAPTFGPAGSRGEIFCISDPSTSEKVCPPPPPAAS